ncbi:hypothetical protein BCEP4_240044 [Burkholderia cepacia]|nr:hypothetical protein BCEP4_240044 [Burkholderia cepacia]
MQERHHFVDHARIDGRRRAVVHVDRAGLHRCGSGKRCLPQCAKAPRNRVAAVYVDIRWRRATPIPPVGLSFKQSFLGQGLRQLEPAFVFTFNKS